jgi:hypothetical protein
MIILLLVILIVVCILSIIGFLSLEERVSKGESERAAMRVLLFNEEKDPVIDVSYTERGRYG